MAEIQSETHVIWNLLWGVIKLPFILILALFGKKTLGDAFEPFGAFITAIFQAKMTMALICINMVVFVISVFLPQNLLESFVFYPKDLFTLRIYTLLTAAFLHASLAHLGGNMLGIFIFGREVERELGAGKTLGVYLISMVLAGVCEALVNLFILKSDVGMVGASGALMGLVSAAIFLRPFTLVYELLIPLPVFLLGWLTIAADVTNVLGGTKDNIAHFAHIGGFLSVLLVMLLFKSDRRQFWIGLGLNLLTLAAGAAAFFYLQ